MMDEPVKTFKSVIEEYSVPCLCETLQIFQNVDLSQFAPANLSKILSNQPLQWRIGKRKSPELQWESSCSYRKASIGQVIEWNCIKDCKEPTQRQKESQDTLNACCPEHYWCYADYKYMEEVFRGSADMLNELKWHELGFGNKTGRDSTMWIGTAGAHTLCHYDTYGYNVVIQISGSKRWVLFPPSDMDSLYPTRIPYEESSVFSMVNLGNPDLSRHPRFHKASACTVVLRPGDILYVPRHWWHYVENLELSVSINMWCDVESDAEDRLTESVTRLIMGAMAHTIPDQAWINPNESAASVTCVEESLKFMVQSLHKISEMGEYNHPSDRDNTQQIFHRGSNPILIKPLNLVNFMENAYFKVIQTISKHQRYSNLGKSEINAVAVVECLTHPRVMHCLAKVIQDRITGNVWDISTAVGSIADALSSPDSCRNRDFSSVSSNDPTTTCTSTMSSYSSCSSGVPKDIDSSESSVDDPLAFLPHTIREQSSSSTPVKSPNLNHKQLTRTPSGLSSFGEADISTEDKKDTGVLVEVAVATPPYPFPGSESDIFNDVMPSEIHSNFGTSVTEFPLATVCGVRKFEKRLKERDSTLMNMIKFDNARSLEDYFDFVMPKLFAKSLIERCGTSSRAAGFSFGNQVVHAMHEALQGNPTLKGGSETLIGRCMRVWLYAHQSKPHRELGLFKCYASRRRRKPKSKNE